MTEAQLIHIPPAQLKKSPTNPRKQLGDLTSLIESVKSKGVLEPILARPNGGPDHLEIICGERRWTAATKASLATVPVLVRELDDDEVLDVQLAENIERADLTPLEEAEAYALRVKRKQSIAHIAERIGRTPSYVAQRLKLTELAPECRDALAKDRITLSVALLLARIPGKKLQLDALKRLAGDDHRSPETIKEAQRHVRDNFMLKLADAPFDRSDPKLVAHATACTVCPKRTGNALELFDDVKTPDLCTDPSCFRSKCDAAWKVRIVTARKEGTEVLSEKEAGALFDKYGGEAYVRGNKWSVLNGEVWDGEHHTKISKVLGKDAPKPTLARNPHTGRVVELVPKSAVDKAIKATRYGGGKKQPSKAAKNAVLERSKAKAELANAVTDACVTACVAAIEGNADTWKALRIVLAPIAEFCGEGPEKALRRRGVELTRKGRYTNVLAQELEKLAAKLSGKQLVGLIVEMSLLEFAESTYAGHANRIERACKELGVDRKRIEANVVKAAKEAAAAAPKAKPAKKKPAKRTVKK